MLPNIPLRHEALTNALITLWRLRGRTGRQISETNVTPSYVWIRRFTSIFWAFVSRIRGQNYQKIILTVEEIASPKWRLEFLWRAPGGFLTNLSESSWYSWAPVLQNFERLPASQHLLRTQISPKIPSFSLLVREAHYYPPWPALICLRASSF